MEESIFRLFSFCVQLSVFPDPLSVRHAVDSYKTYSSLESHSKAEGRQERITSCNDHKT